MNVKNILDYRTNCPICNKNLKIAFFHKKKQTIKYDNERIVIFFDLNSLKRSVKKYKVAYSIDMNDNSFYIDFYDEYYNKIEHQAPKFLIKRFKDMLNNNFNGQIYKYCQEDHYNYSSNKFIIDLKRKNIDTLKVYFEYFKLLNNDCKNEYELYNFYENNESYIYGKNKEKYISKTSIIKFSNKQDMLNRINKLVLFC